MYRIAHAPGLQHGFKLKKHLLIKLLILIACLAGAETRAQLTLPDEPEEAGILAKTQVLSRPTGAVVIIEGEYGLAGRAPYTITHFLKGPYKITAKKHGYENWSNDYVFTGKGNEKLAIRLAPKTRLKAFYRSMLFPGWGQFYSDQRVKGPLIAIAQTGAVATLIYQSARYNDALDNFNRAAVAFQQGKNNAQLRPGLEAALADAQTSLDDRYEARRRWALLSASIYLYNLFDVILFFPTYHHGGVDLSLTIGPPDFSPDGATVGVKAQF